MAVKLDLIDGNAGRQTEEGLELTRIAVVTGVTGAAHKKLINALAVEGMPTIGSGHPDLATCKLRTIELDSVTGDTIKLRLQYSQRAQGGDWYPPPEEPAQIEVGSSLTQVETNKDIDGNLITVEYTYPDDYKLDEKLQGKTIKQCSLVSRMTPETTLIFHTTEYVSPGYKSKQYTNRVNDSVWQSGDAKTWLCTGIVGRSNDGGATFKVTYTFQYREDGWDEEAMFIDPNTGRPPEDVEDGVGIKKIKSHKTANFDAIFA